MKNEGSYKQAHEILAAMLREFDEICTKYDLTYWVDSGTLLGAVRHGGFIPWDDDCDIVMPREDFNRLVQLKDKLPDSMFLDSYHTSTDTIRMMTRLTHRYSRVKEVGVARPKGLFIDILIFDNYNPDGSLPKGFYLCKRMNDLSTLNRWDASEMKATGLKQHIIRMMGYLFYLPNRFFPTWHVRLFKGKQAKYTEMAARLDTPYFAYGYDLPWQNYLFRKEWVYPVQRLAFEDFTVNAPAHTDPYLKHLYGDDYMTPLPEDQRKYHYSEIELFDHPVNGI